MDKLTVLVCVPGCFATKTHRKTDAGVKTQGYNAGTFFASMELPVDGVQTLSQQLMALEPLSNALAIRGALQPHLDPTRPHRRTKLAPYINYLTPPQGRWYAMADIDKLALPGGLTLTRQTLPGVIDHVISQLPEEFQNVSFHWQLSSSAGVGDPTRISIHLWFWLNRPISDQDLKRWGNAINLSKGFVLIDTSLFNDIQPHYTAAPIFEEMDDPFPIRSGLVEKGWHEVALVLPATEPSSPYPKKYHGKQSSLAEAPSGQGFDFHLSTIGDHPGGQGFHGPILSATASHVATAGGENVDKEWLYETVRARVLAADCSRHTAAEVESRASREHIMASIDGAIKKFGQQPDRKPQLYDGIEPHYQSTPISKRQANLEIRRIIQKQFSVARRP